MHPFVIVCDHPQEYIRVGDHPDVVSRFIPNDVHDSDIICLRCEEIVVWKDLVVGWGS